MIRRGMIKFDRWLALSAAMIQLACGGLAYTYAVYSEHLKEHLHFTQEQIDDVGAAKDFGAILGLLSGIFYNWYPPWVTILIGAFLHTFGYTMIWLTLVGRTSPPFWLLCLYFAMGNGGDGWVDTAAVITSLHNFEHYRGTVMGILKAQFGLSAAIFIMVYDAFLAPNVDCFILLLLLVPTFAYLFLAYFVRPFEHQIEEGDTDTRFTKIYGIIILLGSYFMVSIISKEYFSIGRLTQILMTYGMISILLTMFILPVLRGNSNLSFWSEVELTGFDKVHKTEISTKIGEEEHKLLVADTGYDVSKTLDLKLDRSSRDFTICQSIRGIDFWLVSVVVATGAGTGLAIINNIAQIGKALRSDGTDTYVGLISVWNCFGRLLAGFGSDTLLRHGYPRTICLSIAQILTITCCLLLATGSVSFLYLGSALTGLSYGAYWTLIPAIILEVFGPKQFPVLYKLISLAPNIGSYILSAKVVGLLYDEEARLYEKQLTATTAPTECYGVRCFGFALLYLSVICLVGIVANIIFTARTKRIYFKTNQRSPP